MKLCIYNFDFIKILLKLFICIIIQQFIRKKNYACSFDQEQERSLGLSSRGGSSWALQGDDKEKC